MKPTQAEFDSWRNPIRGNANPEDQTNLFWFWCVDHQQDAFSAVQAFGGRSSVDAGPCWSAVRFGQSRTTLADGTIVYIGGEHEDFYDPDFYIYNDVWIESPEGELTIYGYPTEIFPPTDFHSATLVGTDIIVIGSLGYPDDRNAEQTQVFRLDTKSWQMTRLQTENSPGWISQGKARYDPERSVISVRDMQRWTSEADLFDEFSTWELNLESLKWKCTGMRNWSQFRFKREDGAGSDLAMIRMAAEMQGLDLSSATKMIEGAEALEGLDYFQTVQNELLDGANLEAISSLYRPTIDHEVLAPHQITGKESEEELDDIDWLSHRIKIDGILCNFKEDAPGITLTIEGQLHESLLQSLLRETCEQIEAVEGKPYEVTQLQ